MRTVISSKLIRLVQTSFILQSCFGADVKQSRETSIFPDMNTILQRLDNLDNVDRKIAYQDSKLSVLQLKMSEMDHKITQQDKDIYELRLTVKNLKSKLEQKDQTIEYLMMNYKETASLNQTDVCRKNGKSKPKTEPDNMKKLHKKKRSANKIFLKVPNKNKHKRDYRFQMRQNGNVASAGKRLLTGGHATFTTGVAFSSYLNHTVSHLGQAQTIPYNKVLLDDGNHFNEATGVFECPNTGVYLFTFQIYQYGNSFGELDVHLVVDGSRIVSAVSDPQSGNHDEQAGNTAIIRCNAGQFVYVQTNGGSINGHDVYRFSTFSGVLLY